MKKLIVLIAMIIAVCLNSGCATYLVNERAKTQMAVRAMQLSGMQGDNQAVGIGIDFNRLEAFKADPLMHFGAAILDAGLIYGGYSLVETMQEDDSGESQNKAWSVKTGDGSRNTFYITVGDNNADVSKFVQEVVE